MSRRDRISSLIAEQLAVANQESARPAAPVPASPAQASPAPEVKSAPDPAASRVAAGPVRAMGLTLDRIESERRELEQALQKALAAGSAIVELDPAAVDVSFAADRFEEAAGPAFEELKASIARNGQEVPILVRPVEGQRGRYQAAYGHRRLAACRALGLKVRALVRPLTDVELVLAQGLENTARVDLSFIEKACFARGLEDRGFERVTIMAALSTDKTELSKMIAAARAIPERIVRAIGPAPKAGRRRWMQLAEALARPDASERIDALTADASFAAQPSDARFAAALALALRAPHEAGLLRAERFILKDAAGAPLAQVTESGRQLSLVIDRERHRAFADYLVSELPELYGRFLQEEEAAPPGRRR